MIERVNEFFQSLSYDAQFRTAGALALYMAGGGVLGLYIRALYRRFGLSISNRDAFSSNFPILTLSTVLVIFVIKSSLALSLGLVGALSIVRFRAAIKEPEEIVFLFFCIAIGLALGAEHHELALAAVLVFTAFVLFRHHDRKKYAPPSLLLTISGSRADGDDPIQSVEAAVAEVVGRFAVQRFEIEDDHFQLRAVVDFDNDTSIIAAVADLKQRLPDCRVAYMDLVDLV